MRVLPFRVRRDEAGRRLVRELEESLNEVHFMHLLQAHAAPTPATQPPPAPTPGEGAGAPLSPLGNGAVGRCPRKRVRAMSDDEGEG